MPYVLDSYVVFLSFQENLCDGVSPSNSKVDGVCSADAYTSERANGLSFHQITFVGIYSYLLPVIVVSSTYDGLINFQSDKLKPPWPPQLGLVSTYVTPIESLSLLPILARKPHMDLGLIPHRCTKLMASSRSQILSECSMKRLRSTSGTSLELC